MACSRQYTPPSVAVMRQWLMAAWAKQPVQIAGLLVLFLALEPVFFAAAKLNESDIGSSLLLSGLQGQAFLFLFVVSLAMPVFGWRRLAWPRTDSGAVRVTRILLAVCVFVVAWAGAFADRNFYFDAWFATDRVLLAALGCLAVFHPSFLLAFAIFSGVVLGHGSLPLGISWTDKLLPLQALYLFACAQILRCACPALSHRAVIGALIIVVSAFYAVTGVAKVGIGDWIQSNNSGNIVLGAYLQNGWLSWLGEDRVLGIAGWVSATGLASRIAVLVLELGFMACLFNRRLLIGLLGGALVMHALIFGLTGILFWKWMAVDLALAVVLIRHREGLQGLLGKRAGLFGAVAVSLVVMMAGRVVPLGWFDSAYVTRYEVAVLDSFGDSYQVLPADFAPFDLVFAQGRFGYLSDEPTLVDCFGATTDRDLYAAIGRAADGEMKIAELDREFGRELRNERRTVAFERFLNRWAESRVERNGGLISRLGPPKHIYAAKLPLASDAVLGSARAEVDFTSLTVTRRDFLLTGFGCREVRSERVWPSGAVEVESAR